MSRRDPGAIREVGFGFEYSSLDPSVLSLTVVRSDGSKFDLFYPAIEWFRIGRFGPALPIRTEVASASGGWHSCCVGPPT